MLSGARSLGIATTATLLDAGGLTVIAATAMEARAARRHLPALRVVESGVGLVKLRRASIGEAAVSIGLAGSLQPTVRTGTVLVPHEVLRPNGETLLCDPALVTALERGARALGLEPDPRPMVTSATLVTGAERAAWAARGYVAVDMETGLIRAPRVAAVRVVLDSPQRELSRAWLRPGAAALSVRAWKELPWLVREAPRCARLAAAVLAEALR